MIYPVATDLAPTTDGELPSQAAPVLPGIDVGQLDLSTRQAAAYLFPKERGLILLMLLFLQAEVQTVEIDGAGQVDVAIIRLQSIEAFAQQHAGWSKDTTLRYIALLEALQILQRQRHAEHTELHVPLIPWHPSEQALSALDALLVEDAAREKLQQLASGVKARFLLLYGSPHSWPSLFDDLDGTLTDIQEVLDNRPGRMKRQLLQLRVTNLKMRLAGAAKKGDFYPGQDTSSRQVDAQKGDFYSGQGTHSGQSDTQKGDFYSGSSQADRRGPAQKGDFQNRPGSSDGSRTTQKGDFQQVQQNTNGQTPAQKGDFQDTVPSGLTQKGDFQRQSAAAATQKGDFQGSAPALSLNDNVITIRNDSLERDSDSDNDVTEATHVLEEPYTPNVAAKVGRKLALFLENSPENVGGFVAKCKVCTPTVIQAAVIDVLVHQAFPTIDPTEDLGRPRSKAAWFHLACNKYAQPGARIPAFIGIWLKPLYWQDLEAHWKEIAKQLEEASTRYRRYMIADAGAADLVRKFLRGEIEQQALDEALQHCEHAQEKQLLTLAPLGANGTPLVVAQPANQAEKTWMDEDEAEILAEEILRDAGPLGVSKAVAKQEHGIFVVVLTWRAVPMTMKTPQQWRLHLEKVQHSMALQQQLREQGEHNGTD